MVLSCCRIDLKVAAGCKTLKDHFKGNQSVPSCVSIKYRESREEEDRVAIQYWLSPLAYALLLYTFTLHDPISF